MSEEIDRIKEHGAKDGHDAWPEEGPERDHMRRMLDLRMPRPEPEQECSACAYGKKVTGYQEVDWLVPRAKITAQRKTQRERTTAQLARAEAEVARLRRRLEDEL